MTDTHADTGGQTARGLQALRTEVRAFLKERLKDFPAEARLEGWLKFDPAFSRDLGAKGWIGMTWPKKYGGGARSAIERYVMIEEVLLAGAPVGGHWAADRQTGPLILNYGTEEQRQLFLPAMARGELFCCIGLSEPGAGSDLAAVRTRGERVDGGWKVNGQKVWTTGAADAQFMLALVRTDAEQQRHAGLSQLIIDMKTPGITVRPIRDISGDSHFNEVFFDDVFVPEDRLLGEEGRGWAQVTSELGLERSGPERYLSSYALFHHLIRSGAAAADPALKALIGRATANLWSLRQGSISLTHRLAAGEDPALDAAIFKESGCDFEQALPYEVTALLDTTECDRDLKAVLEKLQVMSRSFSLRGGAKEVMRGVIARGIGLR